MAALVRYHSPFGSPAWMSLDKAKALLRADEEAWKVAEQAELSLPPEKRRQGPWIEVVG